MSKTRFGFVMMRLCIMISAACGFVPTLMVPSSSASATSIMQGHRRTRQIASSHDEASNDQDIVVVDAEGEMSWREYKSKRPHEYKLNKVDEMLCWEHDECPVEEEGKFTKRWQVRTAEREPTTETHFDSEGEWEEENRSAWAKKWYEDVGSNGLQQEAAADSTGGYEI